MILHPAKNSTAKIYSSLFLILLLSAICFGQKKKDEPTSYTDDLTFEWKKETDTLRLVATSKSLAPIQIYFHSRKDSVALTSFLLPSKDSLALIRYHGQQLDSVYQKKVGDSLRISYFLGHDSLIRPNLKYRYQLPFKRGKKYEVSQSFNGKSSHQSERSQYAIDFQLNVGEAVHAARGGLVIKVIDWFTKQGGRELLHAANRIVILHDDGTLASYVHLDYKGSFVKEGETVLEGQKIGLSGLTGFTRGPHLHFVVRKERDIAIPVYFKGYENQILKQGRRYKIKD